MADAVELYLIRHGVAAVRGDQYPDDTKRPLTSDGIARLRQETKALLALDITFDVILTSPLTRARQTADAIAAGFRSRPPIVNADVLAPGGTYSAVLDELARHSRRRRIALVGHEPDMGQLAARLIGARRPLTFKKGAICRIDVEALPPAGPGELRWFVTPKMLRRIAKS